MISIDDYEKVELVQYSTLPDKVNALLSGETLRIRRYERSTDTDVLARIQAYELQNYTFSQISYDMADTADNPRYWQTYNVGLNDLSMFHCFKFEESLPVTNKFMPRDLVRTAAFYQIGAVSVEEVHKHKTTPDEYAYKLRGIEGLVPEKDIRLVA